MNAKRARKTSKFTKRFATILLFGAATFAAIWLATGGATVSSAAVLIFVNSTGDGGNIAAAPNCDADPAPGDQCTLRAAMEASNFSPGQDGIDFAIPSSEPGCNSSGQCVINLTSPLPVITDDVEITGPGLNFVTVRRNTGGNYRIFDITATGTVLISGITVENGYAFPGSGGNGVGGGAIYTRSAAKLTVSNCIIRGTTGLIADDAAAISNESVNSVNAAIEMDIVDTMIVDNAVRGIYVGISGVTNIVRSTISRNSSNFAAGVWANSRTNISNSTISDNGSDTAPGGISDFAGMRVSNSTITGNYAVEPSGGGTGPVPFVAGIRGNGTTLISSIVVGNFRVAPGSPTSDIGSMASPSNLSSQGYNVVGTIVGSFTPATGDQIGVTPALVNLGPLQNNGGPTHTIAIGCNSIAIDAGFAGPLTTDQRGAGFPRVAGPSADAGAYERQSCNTPPTIISTPIGRPYGSAGRAVIAEVSDLEDLEENLLVTVNGSDVAQVNGVKVSAIAVSPSGEVTALIDVACNASIAEFDLRVTDSGGLTADAILIVRLTDFCNTAPAIASTPIHRQRGSSGNVQIATVSDAEDAEAALVITLNAGSSVNINGVSVSNLAVNSSGIVTANIAVACGATQIMPALGVTDSGGLTTYTTLDILVDASNPPVISLEPSRTLYLSNGTYRIFTVNEMVQSATDDCSGNVEGNVVVEKATSDEADNLPGNSDGNTTNDIVIGPNCKTVLLRAERNTNSNGRVYNVTLKVTDADGQTTRAVYKVRVPLTAFGPPAVEGNVQLTVIGGCP